MKSYPSIPKFSFGDIKLHTFDKLDGSNLRFEWTKKKGWYKFGTRRRLFDESDGQFGIAIPMFFESLSEPLEKIIVDNRWDRVVVFAEFWGPNSFAGFHENEAKQLTVFDVAIFRKGILSPKDFLNLFGEFGPTYLGYLNWTSSLIEKIRLNELDGITFEGVVGKCLQNKKIIMYKIKTQQWVDKVKEKFHKDAEKIINS